MPIKIPDKAYFDFSGGIRRDKSPFVLKDNELQRGRNFDVDELGRIVKRGGMQQFGDTASGSINNGAVFIKQTVADPKIDMFINNLSATGTPFELRNGNIDTALVAATTTSVAITGNTFKDATDDFEIEGDLITYTAIGGGNTYTLTASTVNSDHVANSAVHQWAAMSNAASGTRDMRMGVYYCVLNNLLFMNNAFGANSNSLVYFTNPGDTTQSDVSGEPRILFATTFRDRIFGAGDSSDATNGLPSRIYFSNLGDGTSWPSTLTDNSFDIEDNSGEYISGLKVKGDNLLIFKPNSIYSYSGSLPIRQVSGYAGAYNHYVVQEVNKLIYTFCPAGVFVTDGSSVEKISEPIKDYIKGFNPVYDAARTRVVTNTFAGIFGDKYFLYIGNITDPETLSDVVLVYDTKVKNWTVYDGFTNATGFISSGNFMTSNQQFQMRPVLFYGNSSGQLFRCFESRLLVSSTALGDDIYANNFSNTSNPISLNVLTKPFDLGQPNYRKQFGYFKAFSERPGMHLSYQIDDKDPKPLGLINKQIKRFQFPSDAKGYRCALLVNESSITPSIIFNGGIFEDCYAIDKNAN